MLTVTPGAPASPAEFWQEVDEIQARMTDLGATNACRIVPPRGWVRSTRSAVDAIADRLAGKTDISLNVGDYKEKFGGARFYVYCTGVPLDDITGILTAITERTCMLTGTYTERQYQGGWLAPLSDDAIRQRADHPRAFNGLLYPPRPQAA